MVKLSAPIATAVLVCACAGYPTAPSATDIIGRGLIVHRDADDFKTQPTGNSGPRMACAVIARG